MRQGERNARRRQGAARADGVGVVLKALGLRVEKLRMGGHSPRVFDQCPQGVAGVRVAQALRLYRRRQGSVGG